MSEPIVEQIAQAIAAKLATITVANGYSLTVSEVVRPRRTGEEYHPQDKGVYLIQEDPARLEELDCVGNPPAIGWRQPFHCDCVVRHSEASAVAMDTVLNRFSADVQKALLADVQWGGLVVNCHIARVEYPVPEDGFEGITIVLEVDYRVTETDPYTRI